MPDVDAVSRKFNGVWFRSTLEARFAVWFWSLGIYYEYEPMQFKLPSGARYLPDFWMPEIKTFIEVKGAHRERIQKAREFGAIVNGTCSECSKVHKRDGQCTGDYRWRPETLFVIATARRDGQVKMKAPNGYDDLVVHSCDRCDGHWFSAFGMSEACRRCDTGRADMAKYQELPELVWWE